MINLLKTLKNNDGLTLKDNQPIEYKTGWQVADYGYECKTIEEAAAAIQKMNGNCGVWLENGIYYVDHSFRVDTKKKPLLLVASTTKSAFSAGSAKLGLLLIGQ